MKENVIQYIINLFDNCFVEQVYASVGANTNSK